jgi:four helix bundle protein
MRDVKELKVWQKGIALCKEVYQATGDFPLAEPYGLTSQMRRAAVAIPSNLAEGRGRGTRKDYRQFVIVARGSAAELETQAIIAQELTFLPAAEGAALLDPIREIIRMLNGLVRSLSE